MQKSFKSSKSRWIVAIRPEFIIFAAVPAFAIIISVASLLILRPDPTISVATIAAVSTLIGSVVTVSLGRYYDRQRERELRVREEKVPEYEAFVEVWIDILMARKTGSKSLSTHELNKKVSDWSKRMAIWGSDDVVKKWGKFRAISRKFVNPEEVTPEERMELMYAFEEIIFALRVDVGYPDTRLQRGDILRFWINDIR